MDRMNCKVGVLFIYRLYVSEFSREKTERTTHTCIVTPITELKAIHTKNINIIAATKKSFQLANSHQFKYKMRIESSLSSKPVQRQSLRNLIECKIHIRFHQFIYVLSFNFYYFPRFLWIPDLTRFSTPLSLSVL